MDKDTKKSLGRSPMGEAKGKYIEAIGRRKTSTARVRIFSASKATFIVNGIDSKEYFKTEGERRLVLDPMVEVAGAGKTGLKWNVEARVSVGGTHSQAEAIRHGLSRALVLSDGELRKNLKSLGYLKRDPRAKERRKFGLKKARKAPQWSKR